MAQIRSVDAERKESSARGLWGARGGVVGFIPYPTAATCTRATPRERQTRRHLVQPAGIGGSHRTWYWRYLIVLFTRCSNLPRNATGLTGPRALSPTSAARTPGNVRSSRDMDVRGSECAEVCRMQDDMLRVQLLLQATSEALETVAAELDARESQTEALNALTEDLFLKIAGMQQISTLSHPPARPPRVCQRCAEKDISLDDCEERMVAMEAEHSAETEALHAELNVARLRTSSSEGAHCGSPKEEQDRDLAEEMDHAEQRTPDHEASALHERSDRTSTATPNVCRRRIDFVVGPASAQAVPPPVIVSTAVALTAGDLRSGLAAPGIDLAAWLAVRVIICRLGLAVFRQLACGCRRRPCYPHVPHEKPSELLGSTPQV